MKLLTRRSHDTETPAPTDADSTDSAPHADESGTVEWTGPAAWLTKGISLGLISCLIAGPCALLLAGWLMLSMSTAVAPAPVVTNDAAAIDERAAVENFAADFVVTWLTTTAGDEKRLNPYIADLSGASLPDQPWTVQNAAPAGIVATDGDAWSVTVAATVADSDNSPTARRYFRVPVVYIDGAMVAQTLPAPVAEPQQAPAPQLAYRFQASLDDPIAAAAGEFLTALLVGGDVTRVISPDAQIRALTPPPYTSVEIDDVRAAEDLSDLADTTPSDGEQLRLLVTAAAAPAVETSTVTVQYALTLTARAGRWEVSEIDTAPAQAPTETSTQDPSTAPGDLSDTPANDPGASSSTSLQPSATTAPPATDDANSGADGSK